MKTRERVAILKHILDELEENMIDNPAFSFRGHYRGNKSGFIKRHKQAKEWVNNEIDSALEGNKP